MFFLIKSNLQLKPSKLLMFFVDPETVLSNLSNLPSDDGLGILDYVSSPTDTLEKEFVNLKMPL